MAFNGYDTVTDRLYAAEARREPLVLSAADVADLLEDLPDEDTVMEQWTEALSEVDVKTLKVPVRARQAIAAALGFGCAEDLWP